MRISLVICWLLLLSFCTGAQEKEDPYAVNLVRRLLQQQYSTGFSEKQLNRLGDKVSVALLKIAKEDDLRDPQTIRAFLSLIRSSFISPELITLDEDRRPRVTLFFLRHVQGEVKSARLKHEINQLLAYIKEKTARYG